MLAAKLGSIKLIQAATTTALRCQLASTHSCTEIQKRNFASRREKKIAELREELEANWTPIYRFPKIKGVSIITKLKNYQMAATLGAIPGSYFIMPDEFGLIVYAAMSLTTSLTIGSNLVRDSIGYIYVNNADPNIVRIAYLNFWGRRVDSIFNINDIVPFSELPHKFSDKFYTTLKFRNNHDDLKLLSKTVEILDEEQFRNIFGSN